MEQGTGKRYAAWSDESMETPDGTFHVAVCTADETGYWRLDAEWPTLDAAKQEAHRLNTEVWHNTPDEVLDIRLTSMQDHQRGWRVTDHQLLDGRE